MLKDKHIVITGASRGLGFEIAQKLLFQEKVRKVGFLSRSKPNLPGDFVSCDFANLDNLSFCVDSLITKIEKINILINNAAAFLEKPLLEMNINELVHIQRVNLIAPIYLTKLIIPQMIKNGGGKILNILSTSALNGKKDQSAYCASKHGLLGAFRSIALEVKDYNIQIYNLCPGGLNTEFTKNFSIFDELKNQKLLDIKDISEMVIFLLKQSSNLNIPELVISRP